MKVPGMLAITVLLPAIGLAQSQTLEAPDGRARLTASGSQQGNGGSLGIEGRVGGVGFENAIEGDSSGGRITNLPFFGALGSRGAEYDEIFGPRIANASLGVGRLTEGIDAWGRLTVLGWPGPGTYDHVSFVTITRNYPNQGAPANAGSFGGLGDSWIHPDFGWEQVSQAYASDDAQTLVTVLRNDELDVEVTITDVVDPDLDLAARNFAFSGDGLAGGTPPFAHYANMNPTTSRVPRVPSIPDGAADNVSDFATVYDPASSVMLHFRPYQADPASLSRVATSQPSLVTALDAVAGSFGPGVYVAIGGSSPAAQFQAGLESGGLLRSEAENGPLIDPFYDLAHDGALSGSPAAFGKTAGALAGMASEPDGSFTIYVAAADDPGDAIALVQGVRGRGFAAVRAAAEADWRAWIGAARLPSTSDAAGVAVAKRALMLIRTAQDRTSGAILANVTTQTPYRQDWVRDGAFFNYALLLAGYDAETLHHARFYRDAYRAGGTWDSLYYPDGAEAGFTFPYEIDSQAFALWALWLPYEFRETVDFPAGGFADAEAYLRDVYDAIRDTADAILLCRDPLNGMQCYASEDDNPIPTQGAQGASTVYLALQAAAGAAHALGDADARNRWSARAKELRAAAIDVLCGSDGCGPGRGGVYMIWPSRLMLDAVAADKLDPDTLDDHLTRYATELSRRSSFQSPTVGGAFQYPMEPVFALALPETRSAYDDPGADGLSDLERWIRWLTREVVEPGVLHYGERIFRCDGQDPCDPGRRYLHTVGFPHIWSGTEAYLAAGFVHGVTATLESPCPDSGTIGEAACR